MKLKEFIAAMERIAPTELAYEWDNVGLLAGPDHDQVKTVLVALDLTVDVAQEAVDTGADLVLTHHPQLFHGVKRILPDNHETAALYRLIRHGIGHFAAHTNLDAAVGGVNDCLSAAVGLVNVRRLQGEALPRLGDAADEPTLKEFAARVREALGENVTFVGDPQRKVKSVFVCGGSGDGELTLVKASGADTFLAGELKHSTQLYLESYGISAVMAGHWETEQTVLLPLIGRLQAETDDVQYHLARTGKSPLLRG